MTDKLKWQQYPEPVTHRSGCKVSWNYYGDEATAREAASAAKINALIQEDKGYDFGYQCPGAVRRMPEVLHESWAKYQGLWEVTLP